MHEWSRGRDGGRRGYPALHFCLIAQKQCLSLNKLTLSLDGGTAPGISLSLHLPSNKVGQINICIYALHFTRELESSCLCCALSPTLKQPFRDGTWTREYSINTIYYLFLSSGLKTRISLPWESSILSVSDLLPGALLQWKKKYLLTLPQLHFLSSWRRCLVFGGGRTLYTVRKHIPGTFQVKTIETVYKTGKECENMIFPPPIYPS